ncbi:hypothetical protein FVR03_20160 [Pontibacter qinzhouensis]|uniref:Uncharacterized protein n=1 Tax=Pontibacter qinzhouensis TaxID=2603253 RepID=A0A5C8J3T6_9BACT|nr:hypothetical protein [Pontibacter qinzhouensis]TXK30857.1 hypothetical protein FVR03_20160 [Pontibacter qinzhouensis]
MTTRIILSLLRGFLFLVSHVAQDNQHDFSSLSTSEIFFEKNKTTLNQFSIRGKSMKIMETTIGIETLLQLAIDIVLSEEEEDEYEND